MDKVHEVELRTRLRESPHLLHFVLHRQKQRGWTAPNRRRMGAEYRTHVKTPRLHATEGCSRSPRTDWCHARSHCTRKHHAKLQERPSMRSRYAFLTSTCMGLMLL